MTLPIYLAMTAAEMRHCAALPAHCAYMACHFSPYGVGLSDLPMQLPDNSLLIINDRIPVSGHDPDQILSELNTLLSEIPVSAILLDLQRRSCRQTHAIVQAIVENLTLPIGVSEHYAQDLGCPVFVSPPALHCPLPEHLNPWAGREIWLDVALSARCYRIDSHGCVQEDCSYTSEAFPLQDGQLHCHYRIQTGSDAVIFTLQRTEADLEELLKEGKNLGVTRAIGLYQEYQQTKQQSP